MSNETTSHPAATDPFEGGSDPPESGSRRGLIVGAVTAVVVALASYFSWTRFFFPPGSPNPVQAAGPSGAAAVGAGATGRRQALGPMKQFVGAAQPVQVTIANQAAFVDGSGAAPRVLSAICPHAGCPVGWQNGQNEYVCPCHGSVFSRDGSVVKGPAKQPLQRIPSEIVDETLYADV